MSKKIVHLAWPIQNIDFDILRQLTVASWIKHGFEPHIWSYDKFTYPHTVSRNARDILPQSSLFEYKGSLAHWKDKFSFKLIGDKGGWFSDLDICWLKPPPSPKSYWFADMAAFYGPDAPSDIYLEIYEKINETFGADKGWGQTRFWVNKILKSHSIVRETKILGGATNWDWKDIKKAQDPKWRPPKDKVLIHFCNQANGNLLKVKCRLKNSFFSNLLLSHGIE